jgi:hypothetical protein
MSRRIDTLARSPSSRPALSLSRTLLLAAALAGGAAAQSGQILQHFDGQANFQAFGGILAGCGDLDGDGVRDLLVGCQEYGSGGDAHAYSGATGAVIHTWTAPGDGNGIADAGDVDGDGVTDVVVGDSLSTGGGQGLVWIYSGATGAELHHFTGGAPDRYLGKDVGGLGDVNGDGRSDVVLGAPGEFGKASFSGVVYVRSGLDGSIIHRIEGTVANGWFGDSVAGVGDTDGDGVTDFAVGAYGEEDSVWTWDTGAVYLYSGATGALLRTWTGLQPHARFGDRVRGAGDTNGDGFGDLIIGAPTFQPNGRVYLYSGATGAQLATWGGYHPDEVFGSSVDGAGDIDRDGFDDVIVGADKYYSPSGWTGFVYAFSGKTAERLQYFQAGSTTGRLGTAVCGVGDVNGDGTPDLAAGAIDETTPGGFKAGRVYLFSGKRVGLLHDVTPFDAGSVCTFRLVGGQPGSTAIFAASLAGNTALPTTYGTIHLSVPIIVLDVVPFGGSDVAQFSLSLPAAAAGVVVYTQAVEVYAGGGGLASHPLTLKMH